MRFHRGSMEVFRYHRLDIIQHSEFAALPEFSAYDPQYLEGASELCSAPLASMCATIGATSPPPSGFYFATSPPPVRHHT